RWALACALFSRFAASVQTGPAPTSGARAPCRLWYLDPGRQSFPVSALSASALGATLLRRPALSTLPGRQKPSVARQADPESLADPLLPLRLHSTRRTQRSDARQPAPTLPA